MKEQSCPFQNGDTIWSTIYDITRLMSELTTVQPPIQSYTAKEFAKRFVLEFDNPCFFLLLCRWLCQRTPRCCVWRRFQQIVEIVTAAAAVIVIVVLIFSLLLLLLLLFALGTILGLVLIGTTFSTTTTVHVQSVCVLGTLRCQMSFLLTHKASRKRHVHFRCLVVSAGTVKDGMIRRTTTITNLVPSVVSVIVVVVFFQ